jgi:predicted enzyme related to lactoylglutathione lyase
LLSRVYYAEALGKPLPLLPTGSHPAVVVFKVKDVDAEYAALVTRGANALAGPQDRPTWGVRSAQIADPDGYIVEIYSQLGANE